MVTVQPRLLPTQKGFTEVCHLLKVIKKEKQAAYRLSIKNNFAFGKSCLLLFLKLKDSRSLRSLENLPDSFASRIVVKTRWREILSPAGDIFSSLRNKIPGYLHFYLLTWSSIQRLRGFCYVCFSNVSVFCLICFLVQLSFLSLQVTGLVPQRCPAHRPSPATPQSRAKRLGRPCPGPAAMDSATAPASSNDTQRTTAGQRDKSVPDLLVGSLRPLPPGRPIAVEIEMGWV